MLALLALLGCGGGCDEVEDVPLEDGVYAAIDDPRGSKLVVAGDEVVLTYELDGQQVEVRWTIAERSLDGSARALHDGGS